VLSAIIKTNNIGELKTIESVVIGSVHGNIVTATFEFNKLVDIANLDSSIYIEASLFLHYNLDESVTDTKADSVWSPPGGYVSTIKGDSVLIGIMDTGIDWNHKDFIDNDELYPSNPSNWQTRIMYIWDQHLSTDPHYSVSPPNGYAYGLEYSSNEINQAIQGGGALATNDTNGHGTHVAGIAASDGTSTNNTYIGMAPECKLIVCRNNGESLWAFGDGTTAGSLDGFDWMLDKADELNLPLIVNQSQGLDTGPHDGSTLYEQAINNDIQNNGLRLVISAGNSRTDDKHASHSIPLNGEHEFIIDVQPNDLEDGTAKHIQFWYSENNSFSISVKNEHVTSWSNPLSLGTTTQTISFGILGYYGGCEVSNLSSPLNNDNLINIIITGLGGIPIVDPNAGAGEWEFKIIDNDTYANETINGYIERNINLKFMGDVVESGTITMPGSAENAITVASYNTKNEWDADLGHIDFQWLHNNWNNSIPAIQNIKEISYFSSKGPLRSEYNSSKPDIAAPGLAIGSSYSDYSPYSDVWVIDETSNQHQIMWGTSMSAPHVTGACALLLQKFPYLTCSDLKTILKENANSSYPSGDEKDWGAGKLDILSAYKYMVGYYAQGYIPSFQTAYNNHPYLEGLPIESVDDYWDLTLKQRLTNGMILKPSQSVSAYWLGEEIFTTWDSLGNVSSPLGVPDTTEYIDATNNNYRTVDFENGTIYWNGNETIYKYLTANFSSDKIAGLNPLTVAFYDSSSAVNTTITSWNWDFGDYEYSTEQNPTHQYNNAGIYNVSLTISDGRNNNTETKNNYINVLDPNTSGFIEGTVSLIGGNGNIEDIEISAGGLTVTPNPTGHYAIGLTLGLYDVTASLNNYQSVTNHNVEVTAGQYTENIVFILISYDIAISVIQDGSGDYTTIQTAIDVAAECCVILVHPGTYTENINYNGKNIMVASLFFTTNDTSYISNTIIDGNQNGNVVKFVNGESSTTVLTGFKIINGNATTSVTHPYYNGGGILCSDHSSPNISNVMIIGNSAHYGGGIFCHDHSSPNISNVTITGNSANYNGGGICFSWYSSPNLENVTIAGNSASESGGGIVCTYSSPNISNVTVTDNTAGYEGGGIYFGYTSSPSLLNATITGNNANYRGGGIFCCNNSLLSLLNVTIIGNNAYWGGSGICCYNSNPTLCNSILWNNNIYIYGHPPTGSVTTSYSNIQGGWAGTGNIDSDPLFIDANNGNYHLSSGSPCINAGTPDTTGLNLPDYDLDGNPRIVNGIIDMGTYEYQGGLAYTNIKVFLEGSYNASGDTMVCSLTVPTTSPYNSEFIGSLPTVTGHSLVDWVQVKLRTTATGSTVDSCNAFLLEDGSVVDVQGNSSLPFYNTAGNEYYIIIHHRNHLDIMSAVKHSFGSSPLDNKSGNENYTKKYNMNHLTKNNLVRHTFEGSQRETTNIDLTIPSSIYGDGYQELETGVYGMYSGDINNDGEVTTSDYTSWYNAYITGSSGYQITDLNMDEEVTTSDYTKWYNNFIIGASSSIPGQTRESSGGSKKIILRKIEKNTKTNVRRKHEKQVKN